MSDSGHLLEDMDGLADMLLDSCDEMLVHCLRQAAVSLSATDVVSLSPPLQPML